MMYGLTPKQVKALEFIRKYRAEHKFSPSYEEVMLGVGIRSKAGASRLIHGLVDRGALVMQPGRPRSIAPTDEVQSERTKTGT